MQPTHWVADGAGSPGPGAYVSPLQMKNYANELRSRPARPTGSRPTGSRPPPAHFKTWASREIPTFDALHKKNGGEDIRTASPRAREAGETAGKALVQPPRATEAADPDVAASLDLQAEETLYAAARDEAAEIVWKHRNPNAPQSSPHAPYAYPAPDRKMLQRPKLQRTRSRSVGPTDDAEHDLQRANSTLRKRHSFTSSAGSRSSSLQDPVPASPEDSPTPSPLFSSSPSKAFDLEVQQAASDPSLSDLSTSDLKIRKAASDLPPQRKTSGSHRKPSGTLFQNPNDHIYEETDEEAPPAPAPTPMAAEPPAPAPLPLGMRRNPFTRFQSVKSSAPGMPRSTTAPVVSMRRFDKYEIHRNEPTQSRNAGYTLNAGKSKLRDVSQADVENAPPKPSQPDVEDEPVRIKDGKEVRSDELRAATGFSLKNRSPKLPTPTMVSDAPGRPIVSFQKDYNVIELKEEKSILPADPKPEPAPAPAPAPPKLVEKSVTEPTLPTRKSLFERPTSRTGAAPSPYERPASRSASPFDRPASRSSTASPAPLKEIAPSSAPASGGMRPSTPKGPFANRSPLGRFNTASASAPSTPLANRVPPVPADPYALPPKSTTPPLPADPIPAIGVTPPIPTISVGDAPAASPAFPASPASPARGRFTRGATTQAVPSISVAEPPSVVRGHSFNAPAVNLPADVPSISINEPSRPLPSVIPAINIPPSPSTRPLPNPRNYSAKPLPAPAPQPTTARSHFTPTPVRTNAQCTACALPISGRIVSAGGHRFHPTCFACYQCGEKLECVAFYPEPAAKHAARVSRIRARAAGETPVLPGWDTPEKIRALEDQDGHDEATRFYCHLDFHECFSPRCKSCKTPIEGEVVVACGAEWHPGHFFCAQCGDPFSSATPFVEKDGYAWCVGCHANRFSAKCRGCRKPVVDTVVKALGSEWHQGCFCCVECQGPFDDGRYFLRGESQDPVCVRCEERRLKA
ncbi:hypothetical protein C7974DRAFT_443628 [Boeremia exigua]|uniref:uncharacterized protein n=1 Tax=Boeremia exigua TaxID=749465 RepID=UPI001E8E3748|nr:uncharacterized protein C7974DRAFT_443628 [Boeremia exigua]KAH6615371.1 hypothetical protein C7974DRAFT_443628 [Boeremia exigua]